MNKIQKQSVAKYFYDMSKGIALVAVVGSFLQPQWNFTRLFLGSISSLIFFIFGYYTERGLKND